MVQNTGLKPFSARKQAVIHQGKLRGFILKLVKNTREKLVLPRKIFARVLPLVIFLTNTILLPPPLLQLRQTTLYCLDHGLDYGWTKRRVSLEPQHYEKEVYQLRN